MKTNLKVISGGDGYEDFSSSASSDLAGAAFITSASHSLSPFILFCELYYLVTVLSCRSGGLNKSPSAMDSVVLLRDPASRKEHILTFGKYSSTKRPSL